jgi:hypothetical protein
MRDRTKPPAMAAAITASPAALGRFPWICLRVFTELPYGFTDFPDLPDRIRGAIGRQLGAQPSQSDAGLLHTMMVGDVEPEDGPRPFTLQCDREGRRLAVTINLAGSAANLIVDASFALRRALAAGIRMGPDMRQRVSLEPSRPTFRRYLGFAGPEPTHGDRLHLRLLTPLSIRRGGAGIVGSLDTLPANLANRFLSLSARWHEPIAEPIALPRRLSDLIAPIAEHTYPMIYTHYSKTRPEPLRIAAIRGEASYAGNHARILPLLRFAEVFHAGSGTALGLGRLRVTSS